MVHIELIWTKGLQWIINGSKRLEFLFKKLNSKLPKVGGDKFSLENMNNFRDTRSYTQIHNLLTCAIVSSQDIFCLL